MLQKKPINPPQHVYPTDPWRIVEKKFYPRYLSQTETIFSQRRVTLRAFQIFLK